MSDRFTPEQLEHIAELWDLPDNVSEQYAKAFLCEVMHHVFTTFGYDMSFLDSEAADEIHREAAGLIARDGSDNRLASVRSFVHYVRENGGEEAFGLPKNSMADWY